MKKTSTILLAFLFCAAALTLGYITLGIWGTILFAFGFIDGALLWLCTPENTTWKNIRAVYIVTLILFIAHKIEEKKMDFFPALSKLTGVPVPSPFSWSAILLNLVGATWLLIPILMTKRKSFGHFLSWTFFFSMGITELAHFIFPLFSNGSYSYFPGMATAAVLAPVAWYGIYKLCSKNIGSSNY
jgi:hypothetical protein